MSDTLIDDHGPAGAPVSPLVDRPHRRQHVAPIIATTAVVALPLVVAVAVLSFRRWYPVLDLAMTEFRLRDVFGRHTPLIGLPGRIGTFPDQGSHPGPLSFWLLAPFYRLFGSTAWSMEAATVTLQMVWIGIACWIGQRRLGRVGLLMVAAVVAVLLRGYGLIVFVQPWNPYLPLIAWIVVLLATWSVLAGDHRMLVVVAVAATFAAQTHIPYLVLTGGLGAFAAAVVAVRVWRSDDRRTTARPLWWTAAIFAVMWVGPAVDQLRRDPGNITRLIDHFSSPAEATVGLRGGVELMLRHFDIVHAYGGLFTGSGSFVDAGLDPTGPIWPGILFGCFWAVCVALAVRRAVGRGRWEPSLLLHLTLAVTLVLSLVSMAKIFGRIWYYLTLWAWGTTTLMIVACAWTLLELARDRHDVRLDRFTDRRTISAVFGAVALVVTVASIVVAPGTEHPEERLGETYGVLISPTIDALDDGVGAATGADGRYAVVWTDAYFFGSQGYGVVDELERAGLDVGVYEPWRVPVTPQRVVAVGDVDAEVILATGRFVGQWRDDPRVVEVASVDPRSPEQQREFDALRAELIDGLAPIGDDELIEMVDSNLFGVLVDPRLSVDQQHIVDRLLYLGEETAMFIGPPGVSQ